MRMVISLILAALLALSVIPTAFAANQATVTVNNAAADHSYSLYQIFSGEYKDGSLDNIKWGSGVTVEDALKAAIQAISVTGTSTDADGNKVEETSTPFADCSDAMQIAGKLMQYENNADVLNQFTAAVAKYVTSNPITLNADATKTTVDEGYYLVVDSKGDVVYARSLQQMIASEDNAITIKVGTPTTQKKVKDINDSDPLATTTDGYTGWQDSADHDIGDYVPFQFTATLPDNYADFDTYTMIFHDKECDGLSFQQDSVKVYVDGYQVAEESYEVVLGGSEDEDDDEKCTFEVQIEDLKSIKFVTDSEGNQVYTTDKINSDSVVTVEYISRLNEGCEIGSTGNPNDMRLEYSILNYANGEGTPTPDTEYTPWDRVIVFTYRTIINKVDQDNNALPGAEFTLSKWVVPVNEDGTRGTGHWETIERITTSADGTTFTFTGLDDGDYMLEESLAPDGFEAIKPLYFSIVATHDEDQADPKFGDLSAKLSSEIRDKEGNVITDDFSGQVSFTATNTTGSLETTVVNTDGSALPETGGIGTTIFYTIGAVIALCAVVLLITKKRMKNQNS